GIEFGVANLELFCIASPEIQIGISASGFIDHFRGEVYPDRNCPAGRGRTGGITRTARYIEHTHPGLDIRCIEQSLYRLNRNRCKTVVVARRNFLPAFMFELTKSPRIDPVFHPRLPRLIFGFGWARASTGNMAELRDIITGQPDSQRSFYSFPLKENAKFFVADFGAFLKSDFIGAGKHESWNLERYPCRFLPFSRDGEVKPSAILDTFKPQITDVLLFFFHHRGPYYTAILAILLDVGVRMAWW